MDAEARIRWSDEDGWWVVEDEYGWVWTVVYLDGCYAAVERETNEKWLAGEFVEFPHQTGKGVIYQKGDGATFSVDCQDQYVVEAGRWVENVPAEETD